MTIDLVRRGVCTLAAVPLAGCAALAPFTRTVRRMVTEAQRYSSFSLRASPDRKMFVIDEIFADKNQFPPQRTDPTKPAADEPWPLRYLVIPPWTIRQVTSTEPLPEPFQELPPDQRKGVGFAHRRDSQHKFIVGTVEVEDKLLDIGKLWTISAQLNADRSRIYLVTGVRPNDWFGGNYPYGYFLDIFNAATGSRIGSSLHLGWENVHSQPRIRTYDNEQILFVIGQPRPDVAIYLPHEWPSRT
jgi:hypothetical protein